MLGFQWFDIYGFDSCILGKDPETHHSYSQPENDREGYVRAIFPNLEEKGIEHPDFWAAPWMLMQAYEFQELAKWDAKFGGAMFNINIHGDGLIAWMIKNGAMLRKYEGEKEEAPKEEVTDGRSSVGVL